MKTASSYQQVFYLKTVLAFSPDLVNNDSSTFEHSPQFSTLMRLAWLEPSISSMI